MCLIITKFLLKTKMQTEEKNNETKRCRSERKNCLQKCFHFFLISLQTCSHSLNDVNSLHCFLWFLLYYLLHLLQPSQVLLYKVFVWLYEFFKNHIQRIVFRIVNLSNLENVFKRNLRTDRARECIFRASGCINF